MFKKLLHLIDKLVEFFIKLENFPLYLVNYLGSGFVAILNFKTKSLKVEYNKNSFINRIIGTVILFFIIAGIILLLDFAL